MGIHALVDSDTIYPDKGYIGTNGYYYLSRGVLLHRKIAEKVLGRSLRKDEHVHHINYNKLDNRKSNLVICDSNTHSIIHARTDIINAGGDPNKEYVCSTCKVLKPLTFFPKNKSHWNGYNHNCKECSNLIRRIKQYSKGKFNWLTRLRQQYNRIKKSYTKRDICWITKEVTCL